MLVSFLLKLRKHPSVEAVVFEGLMHLESDKPQPLPLATGTSQPEAKSPGHGGSRRTMPLDTIPSGLPLSPNLARSPHATTNYAV